MKTQKKFSGGNLRKKLLIIYIISSCHLQLLPEFNFITFTEKEKGEGRWEKDKGRQWKYSCNTNALQRNKKKTLLFFGGITPNLFFFICGQKFK